MARDRARWLAGLPEAARERLPAPVHEYVSQGSRDGVSAAEAVAAWRRWRLLPRVLRDVTEVDLRTRLLGAELGLPFGIAPSTLQRAIHPEGEVAMATAAAAAGALMVVSSNAGSTFAEIGATGVAWWLQAYVPADRSLAEPLLARAAEAGARAVVLTVDTPVVATKYAAAEPVWDGIDPALLRVNFDPGYDSAPGAEKATDLGPADLEWLARTADVPVVVKGVLHPEDARRCVDSGAAAVWVSNHGGRQLDRAVPTALALPAVAAEVAAEVPVLVDGGLRDGLDLATALALGASYCFLGRLPLYALVEGTEGVRAMLAELTDQLVEAHRLAGARTPGELPAALPGPVWPGSPTPDLY